MTFTGKKSALVEIVLFSAAAIIFFRISVFFLIFVIPLAVLYRRQGFYAGLGGCFITAAVIAGMKFYQMASIQGGMRYDLLGIDFIVPGSFLLGLVILEAPPLAGVRSWRRLMFATLAAAIVSLPLIYLILTSEEYYKLIRAQVEAMIGSITEAQNLSASPPVSVDEIVRLSRTVFLNTYLTGYFFTLAVNWVIGVRMAMRTTREMKEFPDYRNFRLPDAGVWVFLGAWALVLVSLFRDLGVLGIMAWNCALLVSVLYACQGIGIIKTWTLGKSPGSRFALTALLVTLLFVPGIRFIVIGGVPLLGVTELWINYRNKIRS